MSKPLFGPDWLENVNFRRAPRFKNGKPMLCLPEISTEDCCGFADFIHWNSRIRSGERACYLVWDGKFLPEYVNTYAGSLHYFGQHPLKEECRGVYYVHNLATGSMDAFRRDFATGQTIDQIWTAPAGIFPSGGTPNPEDGETPLIAALPGPVGGRMSFIEFGDKVCFVGYEPDTITFIIDPVTGELSCQINLGNSYLQVRDAWSGAIIQEGLVSYTESGVYSSSQCSQAYFNAVTYGVYCGVGRNIVSAMAVSEDGKKVFVCHQGGIVPRPGCAKPDPEDPLQYEWARQGGRVLLEWSPTWGWVDTEHAKEIAPAGNSFLDTAVIHQVIFSEEDPSCINEPDNHIEPSHSACLYYNSLPNREYLGQLHAGAFLLSESYISAKKYAVGSEDGSTILVRGLPAGQVFDDLVCGNGLFSYVLQETLVGGGDTQEEVDKCKAVWGAGDTPANCNSYFGDARVTISAYDYCTCSMEVIVDLCLGPCKPFAHFEWYLCLKQDCDYTAGACTRGPVDCFTQFCQPVASGSGRCEEPFWVPMVTVPTTLVLKGYDQCGCPFLVCKLIDAQDACVCPISLGWMQAPQDFIDDVLNSFSPDYGFLCFENSPPDCGGWNPAEESICGSRQTGIYYFTPTSNCGTPRPRSWEWFSAGDDLVYKDWCEYAEDSWFKHENLDGSVTYWRCGGFTTVVVPIGDPCPSPEDFQVGQTITLSLINLVSGAIASCSRSFTIVLSQSIGWGG